MPLDSRLTWRQLPRSETSMSSYYTTECSKVRGQGSETHTQALALSGGTASAHVAPNPTPGPARSRGIYDDVHDPSATQQAGSNTRW